MAAWEIGNMPRVLAGVLPVIQTPLAADGRIDEAALRRLVNWLFACGADGCGTGMVSEIARLTRDERVSLVESLVRHTAGRGAVFAAVTAESTVQALDYAQAAERAGCDALMAAPPLTSRTNDAGMLAHFRALLDGTTLPLVVQDASGYVGQPIPFSVCVTLLDKYGRERVLFKPEAAPLGTNLSRLRDATSGQAKIFEGSGGIQLLDSYRRGITGTMPGLDLLDAVVALWQALTAGNYEAAYRVQLPIGALISLEMQAGLDGFLAVEKYLLKRRGLLDRELRRGPYAWELDPETRDEVDRLFKLVEQSLPNGLCPAPR
jgi:dihydrodipicolinate synthase/N-acetylneuraminate lyase